MKFSNPMTRLASPLTLALWAGACGMLPSTTQAADPRAAQSKADSEQQSFASSDEAVKAFQTAALAKNKAALSALFGPDFRELSTGDAVQDANNAQNLATALELGCRPVKEGEDRITLEIGTNNWPMAIPLVKADGQWHFDTAAGKEEIINRHIGKDELHAIGVCRAYVVAQRQFASMTPGPAQYAQKLTSAPGKKDGLYWPAVVNEPVSPLGDLVTDAHAEGYTAVKGGGPQPYHGYYFRILTQQGKAAPGGKMNYLSHGNLTGGFALLAYPERWDYSGVMTFIVNQDGKVVQRNLGEKTARIASAIKEYNPDSEWALVQDEGIMDKVAAK